MAPVRYNRVVASELPMPTDESVGVAANGGIFSGKNVRAIPG